MRSLCPSVCGWNAVDMLRLVSYFFHRFYHKLLVNLVSLSLTILFGIPCFATTSLKTNCATLSAVAGSDVGRKRAIFENLSTMTKTPEFLELVSGKSVRKSIEISCHGPAGVGRG